MAIDHLLEQLLDRLRHDPDLRRQLAQLLFGRELAQLADQLAELASLVRSLAESTQQGFQLLAERLTLVERELATLRRVVGDLAEQQRATTAQIAALTDRMERVEQQQAATTEQIRLLTERMERVEGQIAELVAIVRRHTDDLAQLRGWYLEVKARDRAPAIFGRWMDETRVVTPTELRRMVRALFTREEIGRLMDADIVVTGTIDEHPALPTVWLVVEVSVTVDQSDVRRALERAELLRRVVTNVVPVVLGDQVTEGARTLTEEERVVVVRNGHIIGWQEAIERWVTAA